MVKKEQTSRFQMLLLSLFGEEDAHIVCAINLVYRVAGVADATMTNAPAYHVSIREQQSTYRLLSIRETHVLRASPRQVHRAFVEVDLAEDKASCFTNSSIDIAIGQATSKHNAVRSTPLSWSKIEDNAIVMTVVLLQCTSRQNLTIPHFGSKSKSQSTIDFW